ncbi:hypothetical protein L195_g050426, partial [Trifolium pratense]
GGGGVSLHGGGGGWFGECVLKKVGDETKIFFWTCLILPEVIQFGSLPAIDLAELIWHKQAWIDLSSVDLLIIFFTLLFLSLTPNAILVWLDVETWSPLNTYLFIYCSIFGSLWPLVRRGLACHRWIC